MYNRNLFQKIHIFSFSANNIIKFERTDFMRENFNSGKDENINFLANNVGSFSHSLEIIASSISRKYDCYCLFGTDEISLLFKIQKN